MTSEPRSNSTPGNLSWSSLSSLSTTSELPANHPSSEPQMNSISDITWSTLPSLSHSALLVPSPSHGTSIGQAGVEIVQRMVNPQVTTTSSFPNEPYSLPTEIHQADLCSPAIQVAVIDNATVHLPEIPPNPKTVKRKRCSSPIETHEKRPVFRRKVTRRVVETGLRLQTVGSEDLAVMQRSIEQRAPSVSALQNSSSVHRSPLLHSTRLHDLELRRASGLDARDHMISPRTPKRTPVVDVIPSKSNIPSTPDQYTLSRHRLSMLPHTPVAEPASTSTPLPRSTKRARPLRGSPVWNHMMALKAQQKHLRTPSGSLSSVGSHMSAKSTGAGSQSSPSPLKQVKPVLPQPDPDAMVSQAQRMFTPPSNVEQVDPDQDRSAYMMQLDRYAATMGLSDNRERDIHEIFQLLFFSMLMHSLYRPQDWSRRVLLLVDYQDESDLRRLHSEWSREPPTHVLGLTKSEDPECTVLCWGAIDQISRGLLDIHLTAYSSPPGVCQGEQQSIALHSAQQLIARNLGDQYTLQRFKGYPACWPAQSPSWSSEELDSYFCQLISTVVHEQPFRQDVECTRAPVHPIWPVYLVEEKLKLVLQQLHQEQITLQAVVTGTIPVPQCVFLHGDCIELANTLFREPGEEAGDQDQDWPGPRERDDQSEDFFARVEDWGSIRKFLKKNKNSIIFQTGTPTSASSRSTQENDSYTTTIKVDHENQSLLVEETKNAFMTSRGHSSIARIAFWQQFRSSTPSVEAITFLTVHLWLSALADDSRRNLLYVDPALAEQLLQKSGEDVLPPDASEYSCLWGRDRLWPGMAEDAHVLIFMRLNGLLHRGADAWVMIDIHVQTGSPKHVEVLLPPCEGIENEVLNSAIASLLRQLNLLLPRPSIIRRTCEVKQELRTLVIPPPFSEEMIVLTMVGHLCGRFLCQKVTSIDIRAFRQNICFYYIQALRGPTVDCALPWNGLMDEDGCLRTTESAPRVSRARLMLASGCEPSPAEAFPRRTSYSAQLVSPGPSAPFFTELALPKSRFPEDMLSGSSGRSVEDLETAIFLGRYPSWPDSFPDRRTQVPEALSLDDYCDLVHSVGGPESRAGQHIILTGEYEDERMRLDWLRDAAHLEEEWLMASTDVDSLSLTTQDAPEFQEAGSFYPYPNRAMTITTRNELKVLAGGTEVEMHTCPNFCTMSFGANNQFRLLVFFPNCREKVTDRMWRNIAKEREMSDWYVIILTALHSIAQDIPEAWRHALEKTIEALPITYRAAARKCCPKGAPRSFIGYRIEPYIMNLALAKAREIVDERPEYVMYRQYFFHLCGINLKLATQNIHGREDESPLNYAFRLNPFIDWYAQNPNNITVDVGLAVNLDRRLVPEELKRSTLLLRYCALRELLRPGYKQPQQDRYCHSFVISGLRSSPLAKIRENAGVSKFQAYHKDMNVQYVHQDRSVGWNFTVAEALRLGHRNTFPNEMEGYRESLESGGSYGNRFEIRGSAWAANRVMMYDPREILRRLFNAGVFVCHPTSTISNHKLLWNRGWASVLDRQSLLSKPSRQSPEVKLLASVLAYWLKGLVKRPDDMSSSRDMSDGLLLSENAKTYGLPSLRSGVLRRDGLRVSYVVDAESYKIIDQSRVIRPGGQRIKSSRAQPESRQQLDTPPTTPAGPSRMVQVGPPPVSDEFLHELVNVHMPRAIWARFPEDRKTPGPIAQKLRRGPLKQRHWAKVVEPLNEPVMLANKFHTALDKLLPPNWTSYVRTGDFGAYDRELLFLIRDHVASVAESHRHSYSEALRRRIKQAILKDWDYLPAMYSHKMWTFQPGTGPKRMYRLAQSPV